MKFKKKITNNIIIIPARKNSKSIKNKNIKFFCGKPLIYWTIKLALASNLGTVCVSTDCKKIRKYALSLGAEAPFRRPRNISQDTTPTEPVIKHAINFYRKKKINFDYFFLLQPTSPFRNKKDLFNAWQLLKKNKRYTSVFSASLAEANNNPFWMIKKNKLGKVVQFINNRPLSGLQPRRQLLPTVYYRNDFIYVSKVKNILSEKSNLYGNNPGILVINSKRIDSDLNSLKDWIVAEKLFKHK